MPDGTRFVEIRGEIVNLNQLVRTETRWDAGNIADLTLHFASDPPLYCTGDEAQRVIEFLRSFTNPLKLDLPVDKSPDDTLHRLPA